MNIVQTWKESLALLKPQNLKPFLLVTVKTILDVYRTLNTPFTTMGYWILGIGVVSLIVITNVVKFFNMFWLDEIMLNSMRYSCVFMFALAMRPSVGQKTVAYFSDYIKRFWYIWVGMIVCGLAYVYVIPFTFMFSVLFLLAAFDTKGSVGELFFALRTAFMMLLYNAPLFALLYAVLSIVNIFIYYFIGFALGFFGGLTLAALLYIVFVPIEVALITNLYIKCIHGQPSLYFKQPE